MKSSLQPAAHALRRALAPALCAAMTAAPLCAQQRDVTFFVIGKHATFSQSPQGRTLPVDYSFFSEIFLTGNGTASNAFLSLPTGERIRFRDQRQVTGPEQDNLLLVSGVKRFASYEQLQSWYPDGEYRIEFDTPSSNVRQAKLGFLPDALPAAPLIRIAQDGKPLECGQIDPRLDLQVSWTPFTSGRADPRGILDDLIFVIVEDATGKRVSHSGRPFENRPFLTFAETGHTVSASAFEAGQEYDLSVEHALLNDVQRFDGVPAMTTYAVTSHLKLQTVGLTPSACDQSQRKAGTPMRPSSNGQVVMFYYSDLKQADHFYGQILGFEKTLDEDWVKFYQTSENSFVGLVAEGEGAWHRVQEDNSVMLSIITREVDAWYERLRRQPQIKVLKALADGGPIRSFLIEDPGGYTVEWFQWLDPDAN